MQDYDDEPVKRPKWLGWVIIIGMTLVVLGMLNLGVRLYIGTPSDQKTAEKAEAVAQMRPELLEGKRLVDGSDCMSCHGVERKFVGPGLTEVAQRYRDRTDAEAYLARKIREGSVGEWGRTIMPRHPQITEAQSAQMAQWIMALAQGSPDQQ